MKAHPDHCRNGHPWTDYAIDRHGLKRCRICARARALATYQRDFRAIAPQAHRVLSAREGR